MVDSLGYFGEGLDNIRAAEGTGLNVKQVVFLGKLLRLLFANFSPRGLLIP